MTVANRRMFTHPEELTYDTEITLLGRIRGVGRDDQAGFLPTTHTEKNNALELLDYKSEHSNDRFMPQRRLQEIFRHQVKLARKQKGETLRRIDIPELHDTEGSGDDSVDGWLSEDDFREAKEKGASAVRSIGVVWGDFLGNAVKSKKALRAIQAKVGATPNPSLSLVDQVTNGHPGIAPLVRYIDLLDVRDNGFPLTWGFDPMRTVVERTETADSPELRHKFVFDPYTQPNPEELVQERIEHTAERLTIGGLRSLVGEAIEDQVARGDFWASRLREMRDYHYAGRQAATVALQEAGIPVR